MKLLPIFSTCNSGERFKSGLCDKLVIVTSSTDASSGDNLSFSIIILFHFLKKSFVLLKKMYMALQSSFLLQLERQQHIWQACCWHTMISSPSTCNQTQLITRQYGFCGRGDCYTDNRRNHGTYCRSQKSRNLLRLLQILANQKETEYKVLFFCYIYLISSNMLFF